MATKKAPTKAAFERSKFDKERKGVKEGSKEDMKMDAKQMQSMRKAMPKTGAKGKR